MRHLLDTNIVSYFLRRQSAALEARMVKAMAAGDVAISAVTRAELRFGQSLMAPADPRRPLIDAWLRQVPTLPWDDSAADSYGALRAHLRSLGRPIGELDTQIAAQALAESLTLVTHNTRHFVDVPGLRLEDWL